MSQRLSKLGCIPVKSLILKFPTEEQVPNHLLLHFIRGYFDGDGHIHFNKITNKPHIIILGTKEFLEGMKQFLLKNKLGFIGINKRNNNTDTNTWKLQISNLLGVLKFKELVYDRYIKNNIEGDLFLKCKYQTFNELQQYNESNPNKINRLKLIQQKTSES